MRLILDASVAFKALVFEADTNEDNQLIEDDRNGIGFILSQIMNPLGTIRLIGTE